MHSVRVLGLIPNRLYGDQSRLPSGLRVVHRLRELLGHDWVADVLVCILLVVIHLLGDGEALERGHGLVDVLVLASGALLF